MSSTDVAFLSVRELGRLLRARELSPVELTRIYLERLESVGRPLNAVVAITAEIGLQEAALAEAELARGLDRGPLHGIPYGVKDIIATAGVPTTWGAAPFKYQRIDDDATVVRRLREAGAVLVAKLATIELAGGMGYDNPAASFTGPTANPWDVSTWTSGSSSGPSAAVAAGTVAFAIGSDTSGSIILPAAWTGTAGLRATYGLVSRSGAMALCWTLDRLGPMCRTADDCGLVLEAIAGPDPRDPSSVRGTYRHRLRPRCTGFRFGLISGGSEGVEAEVADNFDSAVEILRQVGTVEEIELPPLPYNEVIDTISSAEAYSAFDDFIAAGRTSELDARKAAGHRLAGIVLPAHDYIRAQRIRRRIADAMNDLLADVDALIAPTVGVVASGLHDDFEYMLPGAFPRPLNFASCLAGVPAISVPIGFGRERLPTGAMLVGRALGEADVLDAARALETEIGWGEHRPPLGVPAKAAAQ